MYGRFLLVFMVISMLFSSHGLTDPRDVFAINSLYISLESPPLMGWLAMGGDPCVELWQGVGCVFTNITSIILPGANLSGTLGGNLNMFTSIIEIDFGNNSIGGIIPLNLPPTVSNLSLSNNQLIGVIPETISSLSQLTSLSLSNNKLSGSLPDSFQPLSGLIELDMSGNSLIGQLPLSMASLSFLTTLNLQNNQLSGTLDVLQDLPLRDLNIENNLFSGPIPLKLLNITNFRGSGNPFNTTVIPPPQVSPAASPYLPPSSDEAYGPSAPETPISSKPNFFTTKKIIGSVVAGILIIVIVALGLYLLISKFCRKNHVVDKFSKGNEMSTYHVPEGKVNNQSLQQKANNVGELSKKEVLRRQDGHETFSRRTNPSLNLQAEQELKGKRVLPTVKPMDDHKIEISTSKMNFKNNILKATPPPSMPLNNVERTIVNPKQPVEISMKKCSTKNVNFSDCLQYFTIASLQECTNSFSQENLIGRGLLGSVYKGELPDGKLLAIKKLDNRASSMQNEDVFLKLLSSIYKLQHPNVVDIVGYCAEHGQRLIIYEYCGSITLYDALHLDDQMRTILSWPARIRIALGAARALDYLHEVCEPPMMHRNFKSANILLLEDKLEAKVTDCGLAPLMSTNTVSKLSGQLTIYGYGAPEMEVGNYTYLSDIYSFGVVMLELLTGRKSFERSRPRGEQSLVRWAVPQLHDIDSLSRMVDPSLKGAYPSKGLSRFADIISRCLQTEPEFRPQMSEVVQDLLLCIT